METQLAIDDVAQALEKESPQDIVTWAVRTFGPRLALACSFGGASGLVLLDMLVGIDASVPIYYLDTGLLFPQTYEHVARVASHYGITPLPVHPQLSLSQQADTYGPRLWERNPDLCCNLRKIEPQHRFLAGYSAWMTGLRRDESATRKSIAVVERDKTFGLVKVNPLAAWTQEMVWAYVRAHDVPYNPLHDCGYPSVGCVTCTVAVGAHEDERAGRWKGFAKTECGLHL